MLLVLVKKHSVAVVRNARLLPAAPDITSHAAGDAADGSAGPSVTAGNGGDAGTARGTHGRATHRSLLARGHVRIPE
jgi:hypothetical protein